MSFLKYFFVLLLIPILWITHYLISTDPKNELAFFCLITIWVSWLTLAIVLIPKWLVIHSIEKNDLENNARGTVIQTLIALALLSGLYFTWQSFELSKNIQNFSERTALDTFAATQHQQVNDSFIKAIQLLGSSSREVRLGGIYRLEWLAQNFPEEYYWPVVRTLAAYIRDYAPANYKKPNKRLPGADIQAIISFIIKGPLKPISASTSNMIDLSHTDLSFANFSDARLSGIDFHGCILRDAFFENSILIWSDFSNADLSNAKFFGSQLDESSFINANLSHSNFLVAKMRGAKFVGADLEGAFFQAANLAGADFCEYADYNSGKFVRKCATGLTCQQVSDLASKSGTHFPLSIMSCKYKTKWIKQGDIWVKTVQTL